MFTNFYEKASEQNDEVAATCSSNKATKKRRRRRKTGRKKSTEPSVSPAAMAGTKRVFSPNAGAPSSLKRPRRRQGPSQAALALSAKLKEYSTQKRLQDALELYWDESNDSIRDEHHACIVVDCSARCGCIAEGEKIVNEMKKSGMPVNVQAQTALLKGYSHSGMIHKGAELFRDMCRSREKRNRPNVRTLNTLLRGCLWTAATAVDGSQELAGGIATSEESWKLFRSCVSTDDVDCSSYEYYIAQLCYALRVEDAKHLIDEMKRRNNLQSDAELVEAEASVVESLAVSFVALARAMTLLNQYDEATVVARNALHTAETAKRLLQDVPGGASRQAHGSTGGKRGWKTDESGLVPRRTVSNSLFRSHRLSEVESEASDLLSICSLRPEYAKLPDLVLYLVTRLLYFSGGGTTDLSTQQHNAVGRGDDPESVRLQLMNSLWYSFGLQAALMELVPKSEWASDINVFGRTELSRVQEAVGLVDASVISADGFIDFREVFQRHSDKSLVRSTSQKTEDRPLDIELGSGFGDWIVNQAISNPGRDYVAVELRADRVAQTFSKLFLNGSSSPLNNLCCVGSECGCFLRKRVPQGSVATIFVNHPEPPTQTFGANHQTLADIAEGGEEPAHMLNSDTLIAASRCLQPNGTLVIVTDNRWYARLICVTLVKAMKACTFRSSALGGHPGIRQIETFGHSQEGVILYEGQPSAAIGHSVQNGTKSGSSYFDRLWRSGAGTHAERKKRFIISMQRMQSVARSSSPTSPKNRDRPYSQAGKSNKQGRSGKKNRKKSEAKQKRRNERRLAKREGNKEHTVT